MPYNIVLFEPEIPNNTGNIGRLCLASGAHLHLVKPFGFEISDSRLKRAGLDYWKHISVSIYDSIDHFMKTQKGKPMAFLSSHATKDYLSIDYEDGMFFIFGKESVGLPEKIVIENAAQLFKIPLHNEHIRSLNLANAVGIVVYEGLRNLQCS